MPVAERHGLAVERVPGLREVDVGSWAGLTREEVAERFPDGFQRWREGRGGWDDGEPYGRMAERVVATVLQLAARHPGETILVVSHGGAIRGIQAAALGVDLATLRRRRGVSANAEVTEIQIEDGRLSAAPSLALD